MGEPSFLTMRDLLRDIFTFIVTMLCAAGSYAASNYDKLAAFALSVAGLAFLAWRWSKAAKRHLCDVKACPLRHDPTD